MNHFTPLENPRTTYSISLCSLSSPHFPSSTYSFVDYAPAIAKGIINSYPSRNSMSLNPTHYERGYESIYAVDLSLQWIGFSIPPIRTSF